MKSKPSHQLPDQLRGEPAVLVMILALLPGLAERTNTAASKSLIPINLAILCGGMLTSIGASTNILVLSIAMVVTKSILLARHDLV